MLLKADMFNPCNKYISNDIFPKKFSMGFPILIFKENSKTPTVNKHEESNCIGKLFFPSGKLYIIAKQKRKEIVVIVNNM